ncbi:hypothetical protein Kpol_1031p33 [Vanderwaltozyma polyspora DSM 70294]|uniref:Potassium transport protein n=1 Tax=Vanderwaltozyma polyspora (strain ATCC 22028 / DSM 70294 / BCRC 21397 / CBS 2163 / NBRC 10782 / NRRL Y-8283 / UCD 57-17) TaxID=436907 RepID=A7THW7_VANPO|nr:uncharacterized protein Kpol_1031p33 [Vanderwaltozyma polyspora DSM 70294]EDO18129.1 hypothetical protein Kpol_1031p33 [Vanderwaltozyma polyspora DSM 70294]
MRVPERLSRAPTLASISYHYRKSLGHKIRDIIGNIETTLKPVLKYIFPNFIVVHYIYIVFMIILCSILLYPVKNMRYIDCLFFGAAATSQGGLNTVDLNSITLYQQIVLYIICVLCTPIAIHGCLAAVRLYWFERYFDGIAYSSKRNYNMRRTRTLMERELTSMKRSQGTSLANSRTNNFNEQLFSGKFRNVEEFGDENNENTERVRSPIIERDPLSNDAENQMSTESEISDSIENSSEGSNKMAIISHLEKRNHYDDADSENSNENFSNPNNIYKSILMVRKSQSGNYEDEEQGDPIIVKSPTEIGNINYTDTDIHTPQTNKDINFSDNSSTKYKDSHNFGILNSKNTSINEVPLRFNTEKHLNKKGKNTTHIKHTVDLNKPSQKWSKKNKVLPKQLRKGLNPRRNFLYKKFYKTSGNSSIDIKAAEPHANDFITDAVVNFPNHELNDVTNTEGMNNDTRLKYGKSLPDIRDGKIYDRNIQNTSSDVGSSFEYENLKASRTDSIIKNNFAYTNSTKSAKTGMNQETGNIYFGLTPILNNDYDQLDTEQGFQNQSIQFDDDVNSTSRPPLSRTMSTTYLSWEPRVGRNSVFVGLTKAQKEELGGVEYRSLKVLVWILLAYYIGFHCIGFIFLVPWACSRHYYTNIIREFGIAPAWWGFFTSMSAFSDLGLTLTPNSLASFSTAVFPLIVVMILIVLGNTGFPIMLRFLIWLSFKISPELSQARESLGFLLDHPRRCFTLLFPSGPTWWLLASVIGLNSIALVLFIILDFGKEVLSSYSKGNRVLIGLFQAVSTRTAGFTVINLSELNVAMQLFYMLMMYISILPLAISIRRTNVYEEQSLGIYRHGTFYADEPGDDSRTMSNSSDSQREYSMTRKPKSAYFNKSFIGTHLRRQLSYDIWFIFLGLFIICICENGSIQDLDKPDFSVFAILFEIVSAYGTVGLSLGYPDTNTAFSAQFSIISKLIIIAMFIRGRHRGLPYAIDRAIILPSNKLEKIDKIETRSKRKTAEVEDKGDPIIRYFKGKRKGISSYFRSMRKSVQAARRESLKNGNGNNNN